MTPTTLPRRRSRSPSPPPRIAIGGDATSFEDPCCSLLKATDWGRALDTVRTPYEQHRDYVLAVLRRRCGWLDPSDREAILHDAYAVFLEKQRDGQLDGVGMRPPQVRAYLTQTALNKAMDEGKRVWRRRSVSLDDESLGLDPPDAAPSLDDRLASRFDEARIREIVAELPQRQRQVIRLRFFLNRTPLEVQRHLGVSERVYRRELERAARRLSESYELVRNGTFCESRRSLILAYVAGVAGPNRSDDARRHLNTCPACVKWASELRGTVARAAALVPAPVLTLPLRHELCSRVAWAAQGIRDHIAHVGGLVRNHALSGSVRADPSRLAALSGVRSGAAMVLVAGCLTPGSTATYWPVNGAPVPQGVLAGVVAPPHHRRHPPPARATSNAPAMVPPRGTGRSSTLQPANGPAVPPLAGAANRPARPGTQRSVVKHHAHATSTGRAWSTSRAKAQRKTEPRFQKAGGQAWTHRLGSGRARSRRVTRSERAIDRRGTARRAPRRAGVQRRNAAASAPAVMK